MEIPVEDSLVILEGEIGKTTICGIELYYREGLWCEKDDDGEFMPDWDLTWFYFDKDNPSDFVYFEQDPPETAIYNLSRILSDRPEDVESLKQRISDKNSEKETLAAD